MRLTVGCLMIASLMLVAGCSRTVTVAPQTGVPIIQMVNDPIEPTNRVISSINYGIFRGVIDPINQVYKLIFPAPVRRGISRVDLNLKYPVHLINSLLQGKFRGAGDETNRFLINTTIGLLGLFDPATHWFHIKPRREDFGQTFGYYGHEPGFYFVLPLLGPSSGRDALGQLLDTPFDLASWLVGARPFFANNEFSFTGDRLKRMVKMEADAYSLMRSLWALDREKDVRDYEVGMFKPGDPEPSVKAVFLGPRDPKFIKRGKTRKARIAATGKKLPYTFWVQKQRAPLLVILPGLGNHRIANSSVALAEMAYRNGYSVITISSTMNWEFMERAASVPVPGYLPADCKDIINAFAAIRDQMHKRYPADRFSSVVLMGYSLGAMQTLYISAMEARGQTEGISIDRYLAINPPVSTEYALGRLDDYYNAPLRWDPDERAARMEHALLKAVTLARGEMKPTDEIPITRNESQFLIGVLFRYTLRDVIYTSQLRENLGVLENEPGGLKRQPTYDEIRSFSYRDYMEKYTMPYFLPSSQTSRGTEELLDQTDLRSIEDELRAAEKVRVQLNENDFLLAPGDLDWFSSVFGDRLVLFQGGGHLGNLYQPEVQDRIMESLSDMREP